MKEYIVVQKSAFCVSFLLNSSYTGCTEKIDHIFMFCSLLFRSKSLLIVIHQKVVILLFSSIHSWNFLRRRVGAHVLSLSSFTVTDYVHPPKTFFHFQWHFAFLRVNKSLSSIFFIMCRLSFTNVVIKQTRKNVNRPNVLSRKQKNL